MNAKKYLVVCYYSEINYPNGFCELILKNEYALPVFKDGKVLLKIESIYIAKDFYSAQRKIVIRCQSVYQIPISDILSGVDLYNVFKGADLNLFGRLNLYEKQNNIRLTIAPNPEPVEHYQEQIDYILQKIGHK